MKKRLGRILLALGVGLGMQALRAEEIVVFAAASLTDALKEAAKTYEKHSTDTIVFNFAASSMLARQIEEGAPADIFFSADEAKMKELEGKGLMLKETHKSRLSNLLVIVVAAKGGAEVKNPEDLATEKVKRLALAEPRSVPAGIYAQEYLRKRNLWKAIEPKVVPTENVRAALAVVAAGNAEAGIVYKTDAAISKEVKVAYEIAAEDGPDISYPMAVVQGSKRLEAARKFHQFLGSEEAGNIFKKFGFGVRD